MDRTRLIAFATALALVASCARVPPEQLQVSPPPPPVQAAPTPPPANAPIALSWDDAPERRVWSAALLEAIREHKAELDRGNPDAFAPGYAHLSPDDQVRFWAELVIAIAKFESNWNPHATFKEPPPLHVVGVGLLQVSYEDGKEYGLEGIDRQRRSLEDPRQNLRCGVAILARLVSRDGTVADGAGEKARGAARFWSVLRAGKRHHREAIRQSAKRNAGLA